MTPIYPACKTTEQLWLNRSLPSFVCNRLWCGLASKNAQRGKEDRKDACVRARMWITLMCGGGLQWKHACKCVLLQRHLGSEIVLVIVCLEGDWSDLRRGLPSWDVLAREHAAHSSSCVAPYNLELNLKGYSCKALYGLKISSSLHLYPHPNK